MLFIAKSQFKKISFRDSKIEMDPFFLKLDFKDMDLVYYLFSKQIKEYNDAFGVPESEPPSQNTSARLKEASGQETQRTVNQSETNLKEKEPSKPKEDWSKAATKTSDLTDET